MSLAPGTRLGPYEILAPIGAGGMGEVYRGRDPRLGRDVAIKVLPPEFAADSQRRVRFEQEARSASALNHPNIVGMYDIGDSPSGLYVAMELVDGKTLREALEGGRLPLSRAIEVALQLTTGLARAHGAGIVHRDLKPENVMLTKDGFVKILDFGLAKIMAAGDAENSNLPTAGPANTSAGTVMGTAGYMSPEQASGRSADFRSDQFSCGTIVYEMVTGKRPFQRATAAQTMSAVIQEDPEPIGTLNPKVPAPLRWIVERCLAKEPEARYASTTDLARDIKNIRDHISEASVSRETLTGVAAPKAPRKRFPVVAAAAVIFLAALGLGAFLENRLSRHPAPSYQQITFGSGTIRSARFAPDGQTILYAAAWDGNPPKIFLKHPSSPDSLPLELPSANLLGISASGDMAIAVGCRMTHPGVCAGTLAQAALTGGAPRDIADGVQDADWAADGSYLVARDVAGKARIEYPLGKVIYETPGHVSYARLSPKRDRIAFIDHPFVSDDAGRIAVVDLAGNKKILTIQWARANGVSWSADGSEIWFTATEAGANQSLYAVTLSGKLRVVTRVPGGLKLHDIARNGRVLLARESYRAGILGLPGGETRERDLSWLDYSFAADLAPDGKTLLFDEEGEAGGSNYMVYLRKFDGTPAVRLGEGSALGLSPDQSWALASLPQANSPFLLLPTGTGSPKKIALESISPEQSAAWMPDSRHIVFAGSEKGHDLRLWIQGIDEARPRAITPEGILTAIPGFAISPDGKFVAAIASHHQAELFPIDGSAPRPLPTVQPGEFPVRFSGDGKSLYVWKRGEVPAPITRIDVASGRRELWKNLIPVDPAGVERISNVVLAPDAGAYAYAYARVLSDLFVVDGLR